MAAAIPFEDILKLDVDERLRLMELIWDSLAAEPEHVAVTEAQRRVIADRLAEHESDPSDVADWDDVKATLRLR